jgi:hypothetical protein
VSKSRGIEFGSLLHQLGAEYTANPYSPAVRDILLQIDPAAKERFPQRRLIRETRKEPAETSPAGKPAAAKPAPAPGAQAPGGRKKAGGKGEGRVPPAAEGVTPAAEPAAGTGKASPGGRRARTAAAETPSGEKHPTAETAKKPSSSEGLSKRKPR